MDKDSALRTLVKGAGITVIGLVVTNITGYLYKLVIGRLLGPDGYGAVSQGLMIFSITATLALLGLPAGVKRFVSKYRTEDKPEKEKGVIISALEIGLGAGIVSAVVLFLGADWMAVTFFGDQNVAIVIKILAFAVPMRALMAVSLNTSMAYNIMKHKVIARNITEGVVKIAATVVLLALGFDIFGATLAILIGWVSAASLAFYLAHQKVNSFLTDGKDFQRPYRELVNYSTPLIFSNAFGQITSWADVFLVGFFMSSTAVGLYNSALPTAMILGMVSTAIGSLAVPVMTEMYSKNKHEELEKVYKNSTKWIFMLAFPGAILMTLFADEGLSLMFGKDFIQKTVNLGFAKVSTTGLSLSFLSLGYLLFSMTDMSRQALQASGDTRYNMYISIIIGTSNLGLNLALIPRLGIVGAALATALSWIIGGASSLIFAYREINIQPFKRSYISVIAASIISALTPYFIGNILFDIVPRMFIFPAALIFVIIYPVLFVLFGGLEKEDSMILKSIEKKIGIEIPYLDEVIERFS